MILSQYVYIYTVHLIFLPYQDRRVRTEGYSVHCRLMFCNCSNQFLYIGMIHAILISDHVQLSTWKSSRKLCIGDAEVHVIASIIRVNEKLLRSKESINYNRMDLMNWVYYINCIIPCPLNSIHGLSHHFLLNSKLWQ